MEVRKASEDRERQSQTGVEYDGRTSTLFCPSLEPCRSVHTLVTTFNTHSCRNDEPVLGTSRWSVFCVTKLQSSNRLSKELELKTTQMRQRKHETRQPLKSIRQNKPQQAHLRAVLEKCAVAGPRST